MSDLSWFKRPTIKWEKVDENNPASYLEGRVICLPDNIYEAEIFVEPGTHVVLFEYPEGFAPRQLAEYQHGMEFNGDVYPLQNSTPDEWERAERQILLLQKEAKEAQEESEASRKDKSFLDMEASLSGFRYRL